MYRKGVAGLIINDSNEFLLVNLTSFEEIYYAVPGGGLEKGEEYEEAVIREINEELGISTNYLEIIGKAKAPVVFEFKSGPMIRDGITYLGQERQYFLVKFSGSDKEIIIDEKEVRGYVWSSYENLHKYLLFEGQLEITQSLIKELIPEDKSK